MNLLDYLDGVSGAILSTFNIIRNQEDAICYLDANIDLFERNILLYLNFVDRSKAPGRIVVRESCPKKMQKSYRLVNEREYDIIVCGEIVIPYTNLDTLNEVIYRLETSPILMEDEVSSISALCEMHHL